jgi:hypothetical protein
MPPVPDSSTGPHFNGEEDGRLVTRANDYDSFAEAYTAETEANLINGYYMRTATCGLRSWTWPGTWTGGGSSTSAGALARCRRRWVTGRGRHRPGLQCRDAGVGPAAARPGRGPG